MTPQLKVNATVQRLDINASSGTNHIVSGQTGRTILVLQYLLISSAAQNATWESSTGTLHTGPLPVAVNGGCSAPFSPIGWFNTDTGAGLDLVLSGPSQVGGSVSYVVIDPAMLP